MPSLGIEILPPPALGAEAGAEWRYYGEIKRREPHDREHIVVLSLELRERHQAPLSTIIGRKRQRAALWGNSTGSGVEDGVRSGI